MHRGGKAAKILLNRDPDQDRKGDIPPAEIGNGGSDPQNCDETRRH